MALVFSSSVEEHGLRVRAFDKGLIIRKPIPQSDWPALPSPPAAAAGRFIAGAIRSGDASGDGETALLPHGLVAALQASVAETLTAPRLAKLSVTLSFDGRVDSEDGAIRLRWFDRNSRPVSPTRQGAILSLAGEPSRLSRELFDLAEAADAFNASKGRPADQRIAAWGAVEAALREVTGQNVKADGYLGSLTIHQAGSFALDVRETASGPDFWPVLMSRAKAASLEDDAPVAEGDDPEEAGASLRDERADALLTPELQQKFLKGLVGSSSTNNAYVLGRNEFVVLAPELRKAVDVVRRKRAGSEEERRAFIRNPRPALAEALGADGAEETAALLFVETHQYSERVLGLGVWEPPQTPWIKKRAGQWLPERFPIKIGERVLTITPESLDALVERVEAARAAGDAEMEIEGVSHPLADVEEAISQVRERFPEPEDELEPTDETPEEPAETERQVLQIKTNLEGVDYEISRPSRTSAIACEMPVDLLLTRPKPHQTEGFGWLVKSWKSGWPGVLLADDMGLGKTFQALAFLAWTRANRTACRRSSKPAVEGPILIVAPTALLRNWAAEAALHLADGALGECVEAFGGGLSRIKRAKTADWSPEDALDIDALRDADWILTTYETLADNHRAFARVAYSIAVFDEMQKVKSPGTINTHAAKAMNADFVLGLTGTPVENRLEDLWCLMDRIAPGYLGDLKTFSATHDEENREALKALKAKLDAPVAGSPAIMMRRMKEQILEGLPTKEVKTYPVAMPAAQASAYEKAVRDAYAGGRTPSAMLKAIHAFRAISLHPFGGKDVDSFDARAVRDWVEHSARLAQVFDLLRKIEARGEKALVFIEDKAVQSAFANGVATLLGLRATPAIINGETPGAKRQGVVDHFQKASPGFDLLVLSPKAAGVGLTITAANHVLHLSRWWNPAVEDQCNDRVYRIGQTKPVTVHVPIAVHPTFGDGSFDVTLDKLLERKRSLSRDMLMPPVADNDVKTLFETSLAPQQ